MLRELLRRETEVDSTFAALRGSRSKWMGSGGGGGYSTRMEIGADLRSPRWTHARERETFETETRPERRGRCEAGVPESTGVCGGYQILLVVTVLKHFRKDFWREAADQSERIHYSTDHGKCIGEIAFDV